MFFFGGYQRTQAETGFVPTASSITVLPQALQLIQGARTKENVLAAFAAAESRHSARRFRRPVRRARPTPPASRTSRSTLLNLRNPVTGDFVIPAPRAGGTVIGNDITAGTSVGGNPFVRQRNVVPAEFTAGPVHRSSSTASSRPTTA